MQDAYKKNKKNGYMPHSCNKNILEYFRGFISTVHTLLHSFIRPSFLVTLCLIVAFGAKNVAAKEYECSYTVGVVPQYEARYLHDIWSKILNALNEKTGCEFIYVGSKSAVDFEESLKQGAFDLAYVNPVQVVIGYLNNGYMPLLRPMSTRLQGIIVVRKDDPIKDIRELEGEKIVFPPYIEVESTLLPQMGLKEKFDLTTEQFNVKTYDSVYLLVGKKLARAGGGSYTSLNNQPQYIKDSLRVLYETEKIFPHALIVHGLVEEDASNSIYNAFIEIHKETPELLETISMNDPIQANIEEYIDLERWIQQ